MSTAKPVAPPAMPEAELFKRGMRRLAAGVSIVTTLDPDGPHGLVATAVSSVSAEPRPSLLVCVNRSSSTHARIIASGRFCVNLLGEDDVEVAQRFCSADRQQRFSGSDWVSLVTGAPALPQALASFDCDVSAEMGVHSHTIIVGEVREVRLWREEVAPLLYMDGRFARLERAA